MVRKWSTVPIFLSYTTPAVGSLEQAQLVLGDQMLGLIQLLHEAVGVSLLRYLWQP
jgi:hypothetical protein